MKINYREMESIISNLIDKGYFEASDIENIEDSEDAKGSFFASFIKLCFQYIEVRVSTRTDEIRYHFNCDGNSRKDLFKILNILLDINERQTLKENFNVNNESYRSILKGTRKTTFVQKLEFILSKLNIDFVSPQKSFVCVLLDNYQSVSCVGTVFYRIVAGDKDYLEGLIEYTTELKVKEVKQFISKYGYYNEQLRIECAPYFTICSKNGRLFGKIKPADNNS